MRKVKFKNRNWDTVAHLHLPNNFDEKQNYPAIVCVHPGSSVKEQTAGLYAQRLAEKGLIALAYDASFQGESGGEQRYLEDPTTRVEDIRYAVDYLTTLNFIDEKTSLDGKKQIFVPFCLLEPFFLSGLMVSPFLNNISYSFPSL